MDLMVDQKIILDLWGDLTSLQVNYKDQVAHLKKKPACKFKMVLVYLSDLEDICVLQPINSKLTAYSQHPAHFLGGKITEKGTLEEKKGKIDTGSA